MPLTQPCNGGSTSPTQPNLLAGVTVSSIDLSGSVVGSPIRAMVSNGGDSALVVTETGVIYSFGGGGGLVENLTLTSFVILDGLFASVGDVFVVGASISDDGTKLYTVGSSTVISSRVVVQWNMSVPFDPTTISSVQHYNLVPIAGVVLSVLLDGVGTMLIYHTTSNEIRQYLLSDPDDVGTATFTGITYSTPTGGQRDLSYNQDRTTLLHTRYGGGHNVDSRVNRETLISPGSVDGAIAGPTSGFSELLTGTSTSTSSLLIPSQTQIYFMHSNRLLEQISLDP